MPSASPASLFLALSIVTWCLVCVGSVQGQPGTCVPWPGEPQACNQFPQWNDETYVYVPETTTLDALSNTAQHIILGIGLIHENDTSIDGICNLYFIRMLCLTYFRPCLTVPTEDAHETIMIPEPMQPCRDVCEDYSTLLIFASAQSIVLTSVWTLMPALTCRNNSESRGYPFGSALYFPENFTTPLSCQEMENGAPFWQTELFNVSTAAFPDQTWTVQCNSLKNSTKTVLYCDEPLASTGNNQCSYNCPLPSYSESQYDAAKVMQLVLGWLSWAGSLVLILSYALHPTLRKFPSNLIMMCALAAHFASLAMILPTVAGYENVWCGVDGAFLRPHVEAQGGLRVYFDIEGLSVESSLCTFQGWLLQSGFLSSTMWWGIVSLNMFLSVRISPTHMLGYQSSPRAQINRSSSEQNCQKTILACELEYK
ncbi:hypothetical protein QOT17_018330 [Balamuthia mandrillaris]